MPAGVQPRLTPDMRRILQRVADANGPLLELLIASSGGSERQIVGRLIRYGYLTRVNHPTVRDRMGYPADALILTTEGSVVLRKVAAMTDTRTAANRPPAMSERVCRKCERSFLGDKDHQFCAKCVVEVAREIARTQRHY